MQVSEDARRVARDELEVRVARVGKIEVPLPRYQTPGSAGINLHAALGEKITLGPLARAMVPTGLAFAIPAGWEGQIRPRSGLAAKRGITVINTPGTIDSDFRGEVGIVLVNLGNEPQAIEPGERIAQIVFARHGRASFVEVKELDATTRGAGGYGSTGT